MGQPWQGLPDPQASGRTSTSGLCQWVQRANQRQEEIMHRDDGPIERRVLSTYEANLLVINRKLSDIEDVLLMHKVRDYWLKVIATAIMGTVLTIFAYFYKDYSGLRLKVETGIATIACLREPTCAKTI